MLEATPSYTSTAQYNCRLQGISSSFEFIEDVVQNFLKWNAFKYKYVEAIGQSNTYDVIHAIYCYWYAYVCFSENGAPIHK
jgi:hypothetical protein